MAHWLELCGAFAREQGLSGSWLRVLDAFGPRNPDAEAVCFQEGVCAASFDALLRRCEERLPVLSKAIPVALEGEVDAGQAAMFARRFSSVAELLHRLGEEHPAGLLFFVGLLSRLEELLKAPPPRVLRVRAICDFYYSHGALLHHRRVSQASISLEVLISQATWNPVAPGISHTTLEGMTEFGPIHINVLRAERPRLSALDCRPWRQRYPSFPVLVEALGAVAGVSGGFFLYSETDIAPPSQRTDPVGLLVHQGKVQNPPIFRRAALLQLASGKLVIEPIDMCGVALSWSSGACVVEGGQVWEMAGRQTLSFNRAWADALPSHPYPGFALVGDRVVAVGRGLREIPLAGCVVLCPEHVSTLPNPGEQLQIKLPHLDGESILEAMAGGPLLLTSSGFDLSLQLQAEDFSGSAPPVTFSQDETFDQNLLPRLVAGLTEENILFFAAIDGRNFYRAPGFTLHDSAELMRLLGCIRAMNLDGGSSKRMVVHGQIVDLPSTEVQLSSQQSSRIRPVHSAILLRPGAR